MCISCDLTVHFPTLSIKFLYAYYTFYSTNSTSLYAGHNFITLKSDEITLTIHLSPTIVQSGVLTGHLWSDMTVSRVCSGVYMYILAITLIYE